ncbi:MAG: PIN domain-containing protein, partial [Bryobacter sp.]|nr:PIN domain-containing protein [Bryobacter sp.]
MNGILLDTNVISEWVKPAPDPHVRRWATLQNPQQLYLSVLTIGELHKGIVRLPASARRVRLESWLEQDVPDWFSGRILPV